jgi:hypothetical protein
LAALQSSFRSTQRAETDFGTFAYHLWHVLHDPDRMGEAYRITRDWADADQAKAREAIVGRLMQLFAPVEEAKRSKAEKAVLAVSQAAIRVAIKQAVAMLAGMSRMGDMFGDDGAQWNGSEWLVPYAWFLEDGDEPYRVRLSGAKAPYKGTHVPLLRRNAAHIVSVDCVDKNGEPAQAERRVTPNRTTIAALGMPRKERVAQTDGNAASESTTLPGVMAKASSMMALADYRVSGEAEEEVLAFIRNYIAASAENRAMVIALLEEEAEAAKRSAG